MLRKRSGRYVYRIKLTYNEVVDTLGIRYFGISTAGYKLLAEKIENIDFESETEDLILSIAENF